VAAIVVAAVTFALAALIVVFVPNDPDSVAAAVQQQVIGPKLESMAERHRQGR
jgi:FlaG/FlaF family flagellin (archaellin)